jgi:hypothetical protein
MNNKHFRLFPGLWVVLAIGVIFAARIWWREAQYPHQIKELAAKFASLAIIQTRPVLNHAGTMLGIIHTTEHGVGVFMADAKTGSEQILCEVKDWGYNGRGTALFGWSPDDKTFAFAWNQMLCFWTGDGAKAVDEMMLPNYVDLFAWLSPDSCVCIDNGSLLQRWQFDAGHWRQIGTWPLETGKDSPLALVALDTNTVAWLAGKAIWQMNLQSGEPTKLYSGLAASSPSLSYSPDSGEFLLVLNTNRNRPSSLIAVSRSTGAERFVSRTRLSAREAQWINNGRGYVCRGLSGDTNMVSARAELKTSEKSFFQTGAAESLLDADSGISFYAFAALTNEPPGVWKCDASRGELERVYSPWGTRDLQIHYQPAVVRYAPYEKHNARYTVVPPANVASWKKYPLVIGLSAHQWTPIAYASYAQCLANCGAFVAFTGLSFGADDATRLERFHAHTNNVIAIYNQLTKNPNVDRSRVFLFGFSQNTLILNDLVKAYPGRWRGIILFNPGGATENLPCDASLKRVLATAGEAERESRRFSEYQMELAKLGVPMEWYVQPDSAHFERAQSTLRERTLLMADMVFDGHGAGIKNHGERNDD